MIKMKPKSYYGGFLFAQLSTNLLWLVFCLLKIKFNYRLKIMSVNSIKNIVPVENPDLQHIARNNSSVPDFKSLLHDFVEQHKAVNTKKAVELPHETIMNSTNYSSYNQLKVNHIDRKTANSMLVDKIVNSSPEDDRQAKIELAKNRIASGFYFRDDIIQDTAGKIVDSMIR